MLVSHPILTHRALASLREAQAALDAARIALDERLKEAGFDA